MNIFVIILIGAALSADAFAAGMSDAMIEPHMSRGKSAFIALTFGGFQFLMPVVGYYCGAAFSSVVEVIAPYLSFALLLFIGGKAIADSIEESKEPCGARLSGKDGRGITPGKILLQGVATSMDALAVGVTLLAEDIMSGLPVHIVLCALLIGATTLTFSIVSLKIGKAAGEKFSSRAQFVGGAVLIVIGVKILLEGIL